MADNPSRNRTTTIIIVVIVLIVLLLILLTRCMPKKTPAVVPPTPTPTTTTKPEASPAPSAPAPSTPKTAEALSPATLSAPARVAAGAVFQVTWTGPANAGDYISVAKADAPPAANTKYYSEVKQEPSLSLTAPIEPGTYELRYVTARSGTILGRVAIEVDPITASVEAPAEVVLGSTFSVTWVGPNNKGDYVTIVPKDAPDERFESYAETSKGPSITLTAPTLTGGYEVRYISGDGRKALARRAITVTSPTISITAPEEAIAGSEIEFTWSGPNNKGDSITIVPKWANDGQYGKYVSTTSGSPAKIITPIIEGEAELRYMTGQGNRVLARRVIMIKAAEVTLAAPDEVIAGSQFEVTWTGPNNNGDYITIIKKDAPDGQYGKYANTTVGSPMKLTTPIMAGDAEIRYMAGQGGRVLARRTIKVVAAQITLAAAPEVKPDTPVTITWTGPNHPGDYITIVKKGTPDGQYGKYTNTTKGSPLTVLAPKDLGDAEIRYCSGQGNVVLARIAIKVAP
jgi:Ca-activated chloride channel family protein